MKIVKYIEYQSNEYLMLLLAGGWQEHHCLIVDGLILIKMVKHKH